VAGAGAGAVHTVARLLGFGSNVVEWAIPDRVAAVARQAVAASSFIAHDARRALDRLTMSDGAAPRSRSYDELWLMDGGVQPSTAAALLRRLDVKEANLICDPGEESLGEEAVTLCTERMIAFRIFRTGWSLAEDGAFGAQLNPVEQFLAELHAFKSEIEERVPGYFDFHALRCLSLRGRGPFLAGAEQTARAVVDAAAASGTANRRFLAADPEECSFAEFCEQAGEAFDIGLLPVDRAELLNPVDRLFQERIDEMARAIVTSSSTGSYDLLPAHAIRLDRAARVAAMARLRQTLDDARAARTSRCAALFASLTPRTVEQCPELAYFAAGAGDTPVILINALGQGLAYWSRLFQTLAHSQRVIIWKPRGVPSSSPVTLEDHAADIERILDCEAASRCRLVGWCTGAKVALELCRRRPRVVESMVFLNPSLKGPGLSRDLDSDYERSLEQLCELVSRRPGMATFLKTALRDIIGAKPEEDESRFPAVAVSATNAALVEHILDPFRTEATTVSYCGQLLDFWARDPAELTAGACAPVLVFASEFDRVASPAMAAATRDLLADTEYVEIRGATHYCLYDRPALVADLIERFFRRVEFASTERCRESRGKERDGHPVAPP